MTVTYNSSQKATLNSIAKMIETLTGGAYQVVANKVIKVDDKSTDVSVNTNA